LHAVVNSCDLSEKETGLQKDQGGCSINTVSKD